MLLSLWLIVPPPPPLHAHARALSLCDRSSFSMLHLCCLRAGGSMVGSALSLGDSLVLSLTPATHRTWSSTSPSALVSLSLSLSFLSVSGHSVANCCNFLEDLCSMLLPLRSECYLWLVLRGRAHHDNNADAATQWWPENRIKRPCFQFLFRLSFSHASNQPVSRPRAP